MNHCAHIQYERPHEQSSKGNMVLATLPTSGRNPEQEEFSIQKSIAVV